MVDPELLARLPLTAILSLTTRRVLAKSVSIRNYPTGNVLWTAGTRIDYLAVVLEGRVRVVGEARGRQHVVHTEGPGGTLGEVPLFTLGATPATAIAAEPTRCLILTRRAIEGAMVAQPEFHGFSSAYGRRVRLLVERLDRLALESTRMRLAGLLLTAHEMAGRDTVSLGMTQTALAEELSTVREVVVRTLREFRDAGLIAAAGRGRVRLRHSCIAEGGSARARISLAGKRAPGTPWPSGHPFRSQLSHSANALRRAAHALGRIVSLTMSFSTRIVAGRHHA